VGNAVEHGFPGTATGSVQVSGQRAEGVLSVTIADDGAGLPAGFSIDGTDRLGLQIVRTLINAELDATLELSARAATSGTEAVVRIPLADRERG
jgi:two-component sensor histidine kinase